jgi:hypothetical protein
MGVRPTGGNARFLDYENAAGRRREWPESPAEKRKQPAEPMSDKSMKEDDDTRSAICPFCNKLVRICAPAGGDGSMDVYIRHKDSAGNRCEGSRCGAFSTKLNADMPMMAKARAILAATEPKQP